MSPKRVSDWGRSKYFSLFDFLASHQSIHRSIDRIVKRSSSAVVVLVSRWLFILIISYVLRQDVSGALIEIVHYNYWWWHLVRMIVTAILWTEKPWPGPKIKKRCSYRLCHCFCACSMCLYTQSAHNLVSYEFFIEAISPPVVHHHRSSTTTRMKTDVSTTTIDDSYHRSSHATFYKKKQKSPVVKMIMKAIMCKKKKNDTKHRTIMEHRDSLLLAHEDGAHFVPRPLHPLLLMPYSTADD